MKKTAVLVFIEHQLGGLGTQAIDFARTAFELYGCGKVITFGRPKENQYTRFETFDAKFQPTKNGKNLQISDCKVTTNLVKASETLSYLNEFDTRIWMGLAPHCKTPEEQDFYSRIFTLQGDDYAFITDKYINDLYPWIIPHLHKFKKLYSFAETYAVPVREHIGVEVLPISPLQPWKERNFIAPSTKPNKIFWAHQWRGWKNINLFLEVSKKIETAKIDMYASGSGMDYAMFAKSDLYKELVYTDVAKPNHFNPQGKLHLHGFVENKVILQQYKTHQVVPDFTGISAKKKAPNSYVGNYQCATYEPIAYGCALLKFSTTLSPYSAIPKDCALVLEPYEEDYGKIVNDYLNNTKAMDKSARNAYDWLEANCDPYKLYEKSFA